MHKIKLKKIAILLIVIVLTVPLFSCAKYSLNPVLSNPYTTTQNNEPYISYESRPIAVVYDEIEPIFGIYDIIEPIEEIYNVIEPIDDYSYEDFSDAFCQVIYDEIREMQQSLIDYFGYEFLANHDVASDTIVELKKFFSDECGDRRIYPDYFGGMYVNECGHLVLLKVESWYRANAELRTFHYFPDTLVRKVEFSYNYLNEIMDLLNRKLPDMHNVSGFGIDVVDNNLFVDLTEYNPEAVEEFRANIFDSPALVFRQNRFIMIWP